MYQIFLLDIDNTLLDFDAAEKRGFEKLIESYGIEYRSRMLEEYKKLNRDLWDLLEQEKISRDELLNTRFTRLFSSFGLEINGAEAESRYRLHLGEGADLLPHTKETLLHLKQKGKKLYPASNGVYHTQIQRLKKAGIYDLFDGMFISEKIGYEKPSPSFFEHCFKHISDFSKEKTIMVGDSLSSDIQGAINAGIDSCLISPPKAPATTKATYQITDLSELIELSH